MLCPSIPIIGQRVGQTARLKCGVELNNPCPENTAHSAQSGVNILLLCQTVIVAWNCRKTASDKHAGVSGDEHLVTRRRKAEFCQFRNRTPPKLPPL